MTDLLENKLEQTLIEHEGMRQFAYKDTLGYLTIGCGRAIDERVKKGLSVDEIFYLLRNDISQCRKQLSAYGWYIALDRVRQDAIVELVFNLGLQGFLGFKDTIANLDKRDFSAAASCLKQSKWAAQVSPSRVNSICYRVRIGQYPNGA